MAKKRSTTKPDNTTPNADQTAAVSLQEAAKELIQLRAASTKAFNESREKGASGWVGCIRLCQQASGIKNPFNPEDESSSRKAPTAEGVDKAISALRTAAANSAMVERIKEFYPKMIGADKKTGNAVVNVQSLAVNMSNLKRAIATKGVGLVKGTDIVVEPVDIFETTNDGEIRPLSAGKLKAACIEREEAAITARRFEAAASDDENLTRDVFSMKRVTDRIQQLGQLVMDAGKALEPEALTAYCATMETRLNGLLKDTVTLHHSNDILSDEEARALTDALTRAHEFVSTDVELNAEADEATDDDTMPDPDSLDEGTEVTADADTVNG